MHQQSDDTRMTLPSVVCLSITAITDGESSLTIMRERYIPPFSLRLVPIAL
ncbi:Uncharacterized protein APZ42_005440 [Daphnia magna]|uniref:Uncharacterized protein n=1 Tax=Daphnia magna TaxID=35525 RepID=A0A164GFZ4_9CRUS|nr:Uncharacterized protein APZ42_005440 [Daphnia magna]